eukprot:1724367-Prymnesium_polylepis.4
MMNSTFMVSHRVGNISLISRSTRCYAATSVRRAAAGQHALEVHLFLEPFRSQVPLGQDGQAVSPPPTSTRASLLRKLTFPTKCHIARPSSHTSQNVAYHSETEHANESVTVIQFMNRSEGLAASFSRTHRIPCGTVRTRAQSHPQHSTHRFGFLAGLGIRDTKLTTGRMTESLSLLRS